MDIFSIIILFAIGSAIIRFVKKIGQQSKQAQTQAQIEAARQQTMPVPVPKPAPKPTDFRFPPVQKIAPKKVYQEGRNPDAIVASDLSQQLSIKPSAGMDTQFSDFKGSLDTTRAEGIGYKPEAYDNVSAAYQTDTQIDAQILPDAFNRNALIQAVVMSEILKRPGASRR